MQFLFFSYFIYFVALETITHNLLKQKAKPIQLLLGERGFSQEDSTEECGNRCGCPLAAPANRTVACFQYVFFFFSMLQWCDETQDGCLNEALFCMFVILILSIDKEPLIEGYHV